MPRTYHIPGRFHVGYSLLGRTMRRRIDDPQRAESLFIVLLVLLGTGLILVHFLASSLSEPLPGDASIWIWGGQIALASTFVSTCLIGIQPRITVTHRSSQLEIVQGGREYVIPCSAVKEVEHISDRTFHCHYRRYRNTEWFVNKLPSTLLLLHTSDGPVVFGLPAPDRDELAEALASSRTVQTSAPSLTC